MSLDQSRFMESPIERINICVKTLDCFARSCPIVSHDPALAEYRQNFVGWIMSLQADERNFVVKLKAKSEERSPAKLALRLWNMFAALRAALVQMQLLTHISEFLFWELAILGDKVDAAQCLIVQRQETMSAIDQGMRDNPLRDSLKLELRKAGAINAELVIESLAGGIKAERGNNSPADDPPLDHLFPQLRQAGSTTDIAYNHLSVGIRTVYPLVRHLVLGIDSESDSGIEQNLIDRARAAIEPVESLLIAGNVLTGWAALLAQACQTHGFQLEDLAEALRKLS